jgi:hypothetical protein
MMMGILILLIFPRTHLSTCHLEVGRAWLDWQFADLNREQDECSTEQFLIDNRVTIRASSHHVSFRSGRLWPEEPAMYDAYMTSCAGMPC